MSHYLKYKAKPSEFLALTGYTLTEFEALLPEFEQSFEKWLETHTLEGKVRQKRQAVSYKNSPLPTTADKLFFILVYFKSNNLQMIQGALFKLSQPKANLWIHVLTPHVKAALAQRGELPARDLSELTALSDPLYFHDGTERPIPRPTDPDEQRLYYSGKKNDIASKTTS